MWSKEIPATLSIKSNVFYYISTSFIVVLCNFIQIVFVSTNSNFNCFGSLEKRKVPLSIKMGMVLRIHLFLNSH